MKAPSWLCRGVLAVADRIMAGRRADLEISRADGGVYLQRWHVFPRNPLVNLYLHRFLADDEDRALHDHPWASLSLCLAGALHEITRNADGDARVRRIAAGDVKRRGARFAHRLAVARDCCESPVTLFLTGPRIRDWGFHCPQGFVPWRQFVGGAERGCGEGSR